MPGGVTAFLGKLVEVPLGELWKRRPLLLPLQGGPHAWEDGRMEEGQIVWEEGPLKKLVFNV